MPAKFRERITDSSIEASGNVEFTRQAVKAESTTFTGHIPSSPNLQPSDFQKAQNEDRLKSVPSIVQMMPELLYQAFGLGRPDSEGSSQYAKILWNTRSIKLSSAESEFMSDLLFSLDNGLETSLLSIAGEKSKQSKMISEVQALLEQARDTDQDITLLIYPYFKNKTQSTALHGDQNSVEGKYHYRFAFVTGKQTDAPYRHDHHLFKVPHDDGGYPKDFWSEIKEKYKPVVFLDVTTTQAANNLTKIKPSMILSSEISDRIIGSTWIDASNGLFKNAGYSATEKVYSGKNKVTLPCKRVHDYAKSLKQEQRPLYEQAQLALKDISSELNRDFEGIPVIRSSVFENCTFEGLKTDFYSDGLSEITLSKVTGRGYVEGDLSRTSYKDGSKIKLTCVSDVDLSASQVDGETTVKIVPFANGGSKIKVTADEIRVNDSNLKVILGSEDTISLKEAKFKKSKIKIFGMEKADFENAEFEDCEITISSVDSAAFNGASFKGCKIKIEGDKTDFSDVTISGQGNEISLKAKTAVFKGASIGGSTEITGQADLADFEGASVGDSVTTSQDKVPYALESKKNKYASAEFGNVVFLPESRTDTNNTDWRTVKVTGLISAEGEMAKVLYPLFGRASNMTEETAPVDSAGNAAHPARKFGLA